MIFLHLSGPLCFDVLVFLCFHIVSNSHSWLMKENFLKSFRYRIRGFFLFPLPWKRSRSKVDEENSFHSTACTIRWNSSLVGKNASAVCVHISKHLGNHNGSQSNPLQFVRPLNFQWYTLLISLPSLRDLPLWATQKSFAVHSSLPHFRANSIQYPGEFFPYC